MPMSFSSEEGACVHSSRLILLHSVALAVPFSPTALVRRAVAVVGCPIPMLPVVFPFPFVLVRICKLVGPISMHVPVLPRSIIAVVHMQSFAVRDNSPTRRKARRWVVFGFVSDKLLDRLRSEEHTSELQSLMRISYAVFCLKKKTTATN